VKYDAIRTDPTRMAQGIMTGIGFLGAGVFFKEGLTVWGLTTATSIWITAAIGILVGIGFWFAAVVGAGSALSVLPPFRYIESQLPSEFYAHHMLRLARDHVIGQERVHKLIHDHGSAIANLSSRLSESGPPIRVPHDDQKQRPQKCRGPVKWTHESSAPRRAAHSGWSGDEQRKQHYVSRRHRQLDRLRPKNAQQLTSANVVRLRRLRRCLVRTIIVGADPPGLLIN
jgi:hypothetical protein